MSETGSIYIGKLRVFGTDRSGKADVFENGEKVGQITEKELRGLLEPKRTNANVYEVTDDD